MSEPEESDDGRHIVVDGRRWRASNPSIPDRLRAELVSELMSARRAVGTATRSGDSVGERSARRRVADAKTALGERGRAWWEPAELDADLHRSHATIRALLRHRSVDSSICPSEVARIVRYDDWRSVLAVVRRAATEAVVRGEAVLTRGGQPVQTFASGPVRIGRGPVFPDPT